MQHVTVRQLRKQLAVFVNAALIASSVFKIAYSDPPSHYSILATSHNHMFAVAESNHTPSRDKGDVLLYDGVCLQVDLRSKKLDEVWRINSREVSQAFLSDDGHTLVCLGSSVVEHDDLSDMALQIYYKGVQVGAYSVADLVNKVDILKYAGTRRVWLPAFQSQPNGFDGSAFALTTIDGMRWRFDCVSGRRIDSEFDIDAMGENDLYEILQARRSKLAGEVAARWIAGSPLRTEFKVESATFITEDIYGLDIELSPVSVEVHLRKQGLDVGKEILADVLLPARYYDEMGWTIEARADFLERLNSAAAAVLQASKSSKILEEAKSTVLFATNDTRYWHESRLEVLLGPAAEIDQWAEVLIPDENAGIRFFINVGNLNTVGED